MSYKVCLQEEEKEQLAQLMRTVKDNKLYRRLLVISLRSQNFKFKEICVILQISHKTATEWVKLYLENGFEGLLQFNYDGRRTSKLDPYQKEIRHYIAQHPSFTLAQLCSYLEKLHGISVDESWLYRYLKKMS